MTKETDMTEMTVEQALDVLGEVIRRFDATVPTPMEKRGESTMRIEHFCDLVHEAQQAHATLAAELRRLRAVPAGMDAAVEAGLAAAESASDERLPRYKVVRAIITAALPHLTDDSLRADAERLNWIEENCPYLPLNIQPGGKFRDNIGAGRAEIDTAMRAKETS